MREFLQLRTNDELTKSTLPRDFVSEIAVIDIAGSLHEVVFGATRRWRYQSPGLTYKGLVLRMQAMGLFSPLDRDFVVALAM